MAKAKVLNKDEVRRVLRIAETLNHGERDKLALALSIMGGVLREARHHGRHARW